MKRLQPVDAAAIRELNLSLALNRIRQAGAISRAALVRQTGLSASTISSLVTMLLDSGFVRESGHGQSSGGRRPILLQFDYQFRYVLGVDMGATHILAVLMNLQGRVAASQHRRYRVVDDPEGTIALIQQILQQLMAEANLHQENIIGLGITIPTPLAGEKLDRLTAVYMPLWQDVDLTARIRQGLDVPIYLDNDANAGAIAEKWWGNGRAHANLAYIKLGTGVGSGLIVNNEIYRGNGGTAGEIGHTTIDPTGPICRCGNQGCMESFVGSPALINEVRQRFSQTHPDWVSSQELTLETIINAALSGDPIARSVIDTAGSFLGIAIANLINLFNPGLIVLGGELVAVGDLLLNPVRTVVRRRAMPKAATEVTITTSSLGNDAVAIGAATLAMQNAFHPSNLIRTLKG